MLSSLHTLLSSRRGLQSALQQAASLSQESNKLPNSQSLTLKQQRLLKKLLSLANQNKDLMMQAGVPLPLSMLESLEFRFVSELSDDRIGEVGAQLITDVKWILNESDPA